jgi:hypothetical protein
LRAKVAVLLTFKIFARRKDFHPSPPVLRGRGDGGEEDSPGKTLTLSPEAGERGKEVWRLGGAKYLLARSRKQESVEFFRRAPRAEDILL